LGINRYILRGTFVGALGGFLFGFDTVVISGTLAGLIQTYSLTTGEVGTLVSIALWGTVVGALIAGPLSQRYGSREMLRVTALLYLLSAFGCALAPGLTFFLISRFIGGLGIGGSSVLGPVYIAELAPAKLRGRLVGTFQIAIVIGILIAYFSNYCISLLNFGRNEWRWQLGVAVIPSLVFFALLFAIPRSARWLTTTGNFDEAREVLELMGSPNSQAELDEIRESLHMEVSAKKTSLFERLDGNMRYGKPIFLAISIGAFNQLSGINAILYYLPSIFAAAGFSKISGNLQAIAIGAMNLAATLLGMSLIDKLGRKKLLLIGAVGTAITLAAVATIFITHRHESLLVWALVGFIAFFAISQGAVIWVYISEIFPTRVRSKGQSLGSGTHWVTNAILSGLFPVIAARSGAYPFIFFSVMMALQFIVVLIYFPETKQVSLEELQKRLNIL
jgi:MFS transporter, SP family, arabinose:H+ symporter